MKSRQAKLANDALHQAAARKQQQRVCASYSSHVSPMLQQALIRLASHRRTPPPHLLLAPSPLTLSLYPSVTLQGRHLSGALASGIDERKEKKSFFSSSSLWRRESSRSDKIPAVASRRMHVILARDRLPEPLPIMQWKDEQERRMTATPLPPVLIISVCATLHRLHMSASRQQWLCNQHVNFIA